MFRRRKRPTVDEETVLDVLDQAAEDVATSAQKVADTAAELVALSRRLQYLRQDYRLATARRQEGTT